MFNSGSKSGSFLGDYVIDNTFYTKNHPNVPGQLSYGNSKESAKKENQRNSETCKPAAMKEVTPKATRKRRNS